MTFTDRDGDVQTVDAKVGDTLLEVAKEFDIDLEGACEGTLSCSTCHLIIDPEWYDKIPDPLTEEEQDMLDLAYGLTDTYVRVYCIKYPRVMHKWNSCYSHPQPNYSQVNEVE